MKQRTFGSFRRAVTTALVAWLGFIALGPMVHDGLGHDPDWPALVLHDSSQHQVNGASPRPLPGGEHCPVCHLFCGSRYTETPSVHVETTLGQSFAPRADEDARLIAPPAAALAARAPPARS